MILKGEGFIRGGSQNHSGRSFFQLTTTLQNPDQGPLPPGRLVLGSPSPFSRGLGLGVIESWLTLLVRTANWWDCLHTIEGSFSYWGLSWWMLAGGWERVGGRWHCWIKSSRDLGSFYLKCYSLTCYPYSHEYGPPPPRLSKSQPQEGENWKSFLLKTKLVKCTCYLYPMPSSYGHTFLQWWKRKVVSPAEYHVPN